MKAKKIFKMTYAVAALSTLALFAFTVFYTAIIPDKFTVTNGQISQDFSAMPALTIVRDVSTTDRKIEGNTDSGMLVFANIFPVKSVSITNREDIKVIPGGNPFGVKMFTSGVIAVKTEKIKVSGRDCCPAGDGGIEVGDTIKSVNGNVVLSNSRLSQIVDESRGKPLEFIVSRNGSTFNATVTPLKVDSGEYKIGLWIRDSSAGIGTVTFYCKNNSGFAGLGHGICDVDTGGLLPLDHGEIVNANIDTITRGIKGTPGSLNGHFDYGDSIGFLDGNLETGVYGRVGSIPEDLNNEISIASIQEVQKGEATLLTTLNGDEPQEYSINIEGIGYDDRNKTKNMVIKITDERLIEKTGGIVQGMSGSPILQNGKLVGAVTHVFVNSPDKGYAIFAENMLSDYAKLTQLAYSAVA